MAIITKPYGHGCGAQGWRKDVRLLMFLPTLQTGLLSVDIARTGMRMRGAALVATRARGFAARERETVARSMLFRFTIQINSTQLRLPVLSAQKK